MEQLNLSLRNKTKREAIYGSACQPMTGLALVLLETTTPTEQELNDMMKKYEENQEKAKLYHEFRKNLMLKQSLEENLENRMKTIDETNAELVNVTDKIERRKLKDKKTQLNITHAEFDAIAVAAI